MQQLKFLFIKKSGKNAVCLNSLKARYIDTDVKKALIKSASMESQEYWIKNMSCTALNLRHLLLSL